MTDSFSRFFEEAGRKLEQLERDTKAVEPRAHIIPSDEDLRRLERRWRRKHAGRNAHRVKLLGRHPWPWWKRAYNRARTWMAVHREDLVLCLKLLGVIGVWLGLVFLFASGFAMGWRP